MMVVGIDHKSKVMFCNETAQHVPTDFQSNTVDIHIYIYVDEILLSGL